MSKMLIHWENLSRKHNMDCLRKKEKLGDEMGREGIDWLAETQCPRGKLEAQLAKGKGGTKEEWQSADIQGPPQGFPTLTSFPNCLFPTGELS